MYVASSMGKKSRHVIRILLELTKRQLLQASVSFFLLLLLVDSYKLKFVSAHLEFMPCIRNESIIFIVLQELNCCCYPVFQMRKSDISVNVFVPEFVFQQSGLQVGNHAVRLKRKGNLFPSYEECRIVMIQLSFQNFPLLFFNYTHNVFNILHSLEFLI